MSCDYLWVWAERHGQATVLKVRGELDAVTADLFAADAVRELSRAPGPVAVDLSYLDFLDRAGARALVRVLSMAQLGQLVGVRGIQPQVARLLDLIGLDLTPAPLVFSPAGQELLAAGPRHQIAITGGLLEASATMGRLAVTYDLAPAGRPGFIPPDAAGLPVSHRHKMVAACYQEETRAGIEAVEARGGSRGAV